MPVERVSSKKQLGEFVALPYRLYGGDPNWIPPLRGEQRKLFDPRRNSFFRQCEHQLFLFRREGAAIGRAAAFIDPHYNAYWHENVGCFGSYECQPDDEAAAGLLAACEEWLRERHMTQMRGPISFETQNWGVILDDYTSPPRLMSPYNPPFYHAHFAAFGLSKTKDLHIFGAAVQKYELPERFRKYRDHLIRKYDLRIRTIDMKNLLQDARLIVDLSNRSLARNWGYAPIAMEEAESLAQDLKRIVWPELIHIVEAAGAPIAFCITLPDILQLLRGLDGRLSPRALYRLLFNMRSIRVFRIWALGIVPEFHRRGIDTLLYLSLYEALKGLDAWVEANYILEDNFAMRDAVVKLGMQQVRTLRIYEKALV